MSWGLEVKKIDKDGVYVRNTRNTCRGWISVKATNTNAYIIQPPSQILHKSIVSLVASQAWSLKFLNTKYYPRLTHFVKSLAYCFVLEPSRVGVGRMSRISYKLIVSSSNPRNTDLCCRESMFYNEIIVLHLGIYVLVYDPKKKIHPSNKKYSISHSLHKIWSTRA